MRFSGGLIDSGEVTIADAENQKVVIGLVVCGKCRANESLGKDVERRANLDQVVARSVRRARSLERQAVP